MQKGKSLLFDNLVSCLFKRCSSCCWWEGWSKSLSRCMESGVWYFCSCFLSKLFQCAGCMVGLQRLCLNFARGQFLVVSAVLLLLCSALCAGIWFWNKALTRPSAVLQHTRRCLVGLSYRGMQVGVNTVSEQHVTEPDYEHSSDTSRVSC